MTTLVVNRRKAREDIYIGRGSVYGNPFVYPSALSAYTNTIFSEDPIGDYERWLRGEIDAPGWTRPTQAQIAALKGLRLGCFCKPRPCHGDVLARLADAT